MPERIAFTAQTSALPPVAQPFLTLTNGSPVSPSWDTRVSESPALSLPPNAAPTRDHSIPASASAVPMAPRASCRPPVSGDRPNGVRPAPQIRTSPLMGSLPGHESPSVLRGHESPSGAAAGLALGTPSSAVTVRGMSI